MFDELPRHLLKALPSQQLEDQLEEVVQRESLHSSMMTVDKFLKVSLKESLEMLLLTLNMLEEKLQQLWMLSMLLKGKEELSMDLEVDRRVDVFAHFNLSEFASFILICQHIQIELSEQTCLRSIQIISINYNHCQICSISKNPHQILKILLINKRTRIKANLIFDQSQIVVNFIYYLVILHNLHFQNLYHNDLIFSEQNNHFQIQFILLPSVSSCNMKSKAEDLTVCKNFKLIKKLGTGAFGEIYLAQSKTNEVQRYAAKLEQATSKFPQLYFEAKMYKYLGSSGAVVGLPKIYAMTTQGQYNIMLMDLLGKSLEDLFVEHNKTLSLKTVLQIGQQMVDRITFMHEKEVLHRDIKPDNFLMGIGKNSHIVYIVDLGLSKKFIREGKHIEYKEGKQLTGTARYASINTHMGIQQSRRDDIQSIGYVIMYLLRGILPWQNMKAKDTKAKYKAIMQKKISTPPEVLCKGFPSQLATFISYARDLKFQEKPDYLYLKSLLVEARKKNKIQVDYIYDWSSKNNTEELISLKKINAEKQEEKKMIQETKQTSNNKNFHGVSNSNSNKPGSFMNQSKGRVTNISKNIPLKAEHRNEKSPFEEILTTQKILGPKISVIKK